MYWKFEITSNGLIRIWLYYDTLLLKKIEKEWNTFDAYFASQIVYKKKYEKKFKKKFELTKDTFLDRVAIIKKV